jgi:hypothetical protein
MLTLLMMIQAAAAQQPLQLICGGSGTANKVAYGSANSYSSGAGHVGGVPFAGSASTTTTVTGTRQQGFADQVDVRLFSGDDRIRLPRTMLPAIRGGEGGWFKLKNVEVTERAITAKAAVNFINSPNVRIDRLTGVISISGKAGDYTGSCEAVAADAKPKF